jgi:nondiscriminating aspartyl-tRNA synthetase
MRKTFVADLPAHVGREIVLAGWVHRLRALASTTFVILKDASGLAQCVAATDALKDVHVSVDDAVEIVGTPRSDARSKFAGLEVDVKSLRVLGAAAEDLPFHPAQDLGAVGIETVLSHRPLSLRNDRIGGAFRVQAALLEGFREGLRRRRFTEIVTSKIVGGGTEGGANLFEIAYFERTAYLAQSPQFFKEHGVCGLERVFETGHVYRAEPHATTRHLAEYYSLDLEMGFVDGPEDVIALERELLTEVFANLEARHADVLRLFRKDFLPTLERAPTWEFGECLDRLRRAHGRSDLVDDLDPEGERQLCTIAEEELGVPAVFVLGFPLASRPFYTHPRGDSGAAQSFDLLFRGLEVTTGGQRLHTRAALETSLRSRNVDPATFADHLRMFDLGMPPHGGLAIGLERLTAQVLGLPNIRSATLYPRDRTHLSP